MKAAKVILFALPLLAIAPASAKVPEKAPLVKYTGLWTNSPFTSKPAEIGPGLEVNPLEDYTLTGISPIPGGYRVTVVNKKNPEKKEVIAPGEANASGFKIVSVNRNPGKALGTTVTLSSGSVQGTVFFEPELLTLKAAPAAAPAQQGNPNLPPGINPAITNGAAPVPVAGGEGARTPRPRIVPPATPQGNGAKTPASPGSSGTGKSDSQRPMIRRR